MAYPFAKAITWKELIDAFKPFGVEFKEEQINGCKVQYFENTMDGNVYAHPVDILDQDERLLPSTLRSVCVGLKVNPKMFGLEIG